MTTTSGSAPNTLVLNADPEHAGLRVTIILVLVAAIFLAFLLLRALLTRYLPQIGSPAVLACLGAIPLALALSAGIEALLRRSWPSGRRLVLDARGLTLQRAGRDEATLRWDEPIAATWWHFPLAGYQRGGRERRIPDRWHCVAGQLQQGDARIVAFAFVPSAKVEALQGRVPLFTLEPKDVYDSSLRRRLEGPARPELPAELIAGEAGPYWLAERNRWQQGVELLPDDFERLLVSLRERQATPIAH